MAVVYQGSGTLLGALTTADVTPAIPAHQADDILICITANRVITNTCATPSGWNLLYGPVDETAWRSYVFWKRATSGAETNPLCNWTATSADKYAQVHTFRGAITTGSPFADTAWTDGATDPAVATGVTTAAAGQRVAVIGLCADNLSTGATVTATDPASFGTTNSHTTVTTGADATGFCYSAARTTTGATGNVSVDFNAAPLHWGIVVAAFTEPPPPAGPTVTPFEASWSATTSPKDITVTGCLTGDLLVVLAGGDGGLSGNAVTASTVTTNSGSTGTWADIDKNLPSGGGAGWVHSAQADVTADGDVVVRLARTQTGTARVWGGCVLLCRDHGGVGNHVRSAPSATETASLTTSQDSAVGMEAWDYDALGAVAISPAGGTEVERAQQGSGPDMTVYAAYWLGQAAGTRGYGIATSSTTNLHIIAIEILAAGSGVSGAATPIQAADTSTASGKLGYSGSAAASQAANTATASGAVSGPVTGTATPVQANQTATASGKLGYSGTATPSQAANTATAVGKLGYSGTTAATQAAQTSAATGQLGYSGTAAPAQAANTATASGIFTAGGAIAGSVAVTQADQTGAGAGKLGYTGAAAPSQASQTAAAVGKLGYTGAGAVAQAANTAAASGAVAGPVSGTAAPTQANQTATAVGILRYTGTAAAVQANQVVVAVGVFFVPITGAAAVTQANQTATASGSALGDTVPRPDLGTTSRPGSSTTPRPSLGSTSRPVSGTTPRPFTGTTQR